MSEVAKIERVILHLLSRRDPGKTICPSDAARAAWGDDAFRAHMGEVRDVVFAMADRGAIEVTQRGEVVEGRAARGPIRLRLV